jgi:hypothetical protein
MKHPRVSEGSQLQIFVAVIAAIVIEALACPSIRCTTFTLVPAETARDAAVLGGAPMVSPTRSWPPVRDCGG